MVGILTFMTRKNFMLSWVEYEKNVYNLWAKSSWVFDDYYGGIFFKFP